MALSLAPNPVLEAYMAGIQQRQQKEQFNQELTLRQQQEQARKEEAEAQIEEQRKQHDRENARQETLDNFNRSLLEMKQQQEQQELFTKTGVTPPGLTKTVPTFSQPYQVPPENTSEASPLSQILGVPSPQMASLPTDFSGIPQGQVGLTDAKGRTINAVTPEANAKQQARVLEITQGPLIEKARIAEREKADAAMELEKLKNKGNIDVKELEIKSERLKEANANSARLGQIALENAGKLAAANARGTTDKAKQQAIGITTKFQTNKLTQTHSTLSGIVDEANAIPNDTKNPSDDTELAYLFAKSQDPSYALRGDKFNVVKENAQSIADKFGVAVNRISGDATFLTSKARQQIKDTIKRKVDSTDKQYDLLKTDTAAQFKNIKEKPEDWLPSEFQTQSNGIAVGSTVSVGGKKITITKVYPDGTFDGNEAK